MIELVSAAIAETENSKLQTINTIFCMFFSQVIDTL